MIHEANKGVYSQILTVLVAAGLICSWGAWIVLSQFSGENMDTSIMEERSKPFLYYALHGSGMLAVIAAGGIAGFKGGYNRLGSLYKAAFWVLQIASLTWGVIAYNLNDVASWKALGATGPVVWLSCVFIFAGMERSIWKTIDPLINMIAYVTAVLAIVEMASANFAVGQRFFSSHVRYMILLMWFGGWTFLSIWNANGWKIILKSFPYVVFIFSCIVTQTRSWLLMSIFLYIALFFITRRTRMSLKKVRAIRVIIPYILLMVFLLIGLFAREQVQNTLEGIIDRLNVDSRTGQYVEFFEQVPVSDLILGRGPKGSYVFGAREEYQFFDNAYIWMAFIGGFPILISYFVLIILPGIKTYLQGARDKEAMAAAMVILWGVACTGVSTYSLPSLSPYCYLLYLFAGRCLGNLHGNRLHPLR